MELWYTFVFLGNFVGFMENQVHDVVDVGGKTTDVVSLNMLQDTIHDV